MESNFFRVSGGADLSIIRNADSIPVMTVDSISFKETRTYAQRTIPVIGYKNGKRVLISNVVPANTPMNWD